MSHSLETAKNLEKTATDLEVAARLVSAELDKQVERIKYNKSRLIDILQESNSLDSKIRATREYCLYFEGESEQPITEIRDEIYRRIRIVKELVDKFSYIQVK